MKKNFMFIKLLLSLIFCLSATAFGQETTGNIEGSVKDVAGGVVPNITLTITSASGMRAALQQPA